VKIAVFLELKNPKSGGAYSFNKLIFENLSKNRAFYEHEILLVFSKKNSVNALPDIPMPGKTQYRFWFLKSMVTQLFSLSILKLRLNLESCRGAYIDRILTKHKVDAVWAVQPLGIPVNRPFFTTIWDIAHKITPYFPEVSQGGKLLRNRDKVCSSVFSRAMRIIVGTEIGKKEIEVAYGVNSDRIIVNPLPIRNSSVQNSNRKNRYKIIYPANFWAHKNHAILINALRIAIDRTGDPLQLFLTGSDKGSKHLIIELVKDLALEDSVFFMGHLSESELIDLYRDCNLLVFPSLIGPDNLPPLEALIFGCKIAVTDIPGAREQFDKFATYFDPYNVLEISATIESLTANLNIAYDLKELNNFLSSKSCELYVDRVLREFDKFKYIVKYV
jgi:glycosyltransferase involved in cell wall biosynthesis